MLEDYAINISQERLLYFIENIRIINYSKRKKYMYFSFKTPCKNIHYSFTKSIEHKH